MNLEGGGGEDQALGAETLGMSLHRRCPGSLPRVSEFTPCASVCRAVKWEDHNPDLVDLQRKEAAESCKACSTGSATELDVGQLFSGLYCALYKSINYRHTTISLLLFLHLAFFTNTVICRSFKRHTYRSQILKDCSRWGWTRPISGAQNSFWASHMVAGT